MSIGVKKCWKNTMEVPQKTFLRSSQETIHRFVRKSTKQHNSPPCGSLNPSQIQRKLLVEKSLRSKWWPVSSGKLIMWRLFHLNIVGRSILSGTPQFVCGQRFSSPEDTVGVFKNHVLEVSQSDWENKHKRRSYIKTFCLPLC